MENLVTQIINADSFTSGAWMLYGFSALGVVLSVWILVRKLNELIIKSLIMSVVVFLVFTVAHVQLESGTQLWVPALPFMGVDVAFQGMKYFDQLMPYLVISFCISLVGCSLIGVIGRHVIQSRSAKKDAATDDQATKHQ